MTFKEYFNKTYGEDYAHLFLESPMENEPIDRHHLNHDWSNYDQAGFILQNGKFEGEFEGLKVFYHKRFAEDEEHLFFIHGDKIVAAQVDYSLRGEGVVINFAWKRKGAWGSIMPRIYSQYLLNRYKFIQSDNSQTIKGFGIYKEMIQRQEFYDIRMAVRNIITGEEFELKTLEDLARYFGKGMEYAKYVFKIYRK